MDNSETFVSQPASRRSFLKKGVLGARTRQLLAGLLANASVAGQEQGSGSCSKANAIRSLASLPALPSAELNQKLFPGFISEDVQTSGATVHTLHKGSGPPLLLLHIAGPFFPNSRKIRHFPKFPHLSLALSICFQCVVWPASCRPPQRQPRYSKFRWIVTTDTTYTDDLEDREIGAARIYCFCPHWPH